MSTRLQCLFYTGSVVLMLSIVPPAVAQQPAQGTHEAAVVTWSADLEGKNETPAVKTQAAARAEFEFDFRKQEAIVKIRGQNLRDVSKIVLGVEQPQKELNAAAAKMVLYDASKDGPFPRTNTSDAGYGKLPVIFSKTFSGSDFQAISHAVLNGQAIVEVRTRTHPEGELIGLVQMHKSYR